MPPALNHAQNIVHAFGLGLVMVMGALYQYAAPRVTRSREHKHMATYQPRSRKT